MSDLRITEITFDGIKNNLLNLFQSQDFWVDYDFQASGLNTLVDLLAYDRHYDNFYGNMLYAENYLDSAQRRESVVSLASELLYTPGSIKASRMIIDLTLSPQPGQVFNQQSIILPRNTLFKTTKTGKTANFITTKTYTSVKQSNGTHSFFDVELVEGQISSYDFIVNKNNKWQTFVLPNNNIDTNFLEVYVQEGSDDTKLVKYHKIKDILSLDENSNVFFLSESKNGNFQIQFGDNILGKDIKQGKIIRTLFLETNGKKSNNAVKPVLIQSSNSIFTDNIINIVQVGPSFGGGDPETIESIRYNAPKHYVTRKRAVSQFDWETIITQNFDGIKSVKVWGGEDEDIPYGHHGRVYCAINPEDNVVITEARKKVIIDELKSNYRIILTTPIIVDPDLLYLKLNVQILLNTLELDTDINRIKSNILSSILSYSDNRLERFSANFEQSEVTSLIKNVDDKLISNTLIDVIIEHRLNPFVGRLSPYDITFRNSIKPGTLTSNEIQWDNRKVYLKDNNGILQLFEIINAKSVVVNDNMGTIDYNNGRINIYPIYIQRANKNTFDWRINAVPLSDNIVTKRNKILTIDETAINIQLNTNNENLVRVS